MPITVKEIFENIKDLMNSKQINETAKIRFAINSKDELDILSVYGDKKNNIVWIDLKTKLPSTTG